MFTEDTDGPSESSGVKEAKVALEILKVASNMPPPQDRGRINNESISRKLR